MTPHPKPKRVEDKKYLRWVREKRCQVPGCYGIADAEHAKTVGSGGSDYFAWGCCRDHHTKRHLWGLETFQERLDINVWQIVAENLHEWFVGGKNGADRT